MYLRKRTAESLNHKLSAVLFFREEINGNIPAHGSHADRPQPEKRGCGCRGIRRMHNQARIATGELEKQLSCGDPGLIMRMARYFAQDYARNDRFCYWFFRMEEVYWTQQDRQNAWRNRADGPER